MPRRIRKTKTLVFLFDPNHNSQLTLHYPFFLFRLRFAATTKKSLIWSSSAPKLKIEDWSRIVMSTTTTGTQAYGEAWYWDNRYSNEPSPFDWYQKFITLSPIIHLYVPSRTHSILVVGSGNSGKLHFFFRSLSLSLYAISFIYLRPPHFPFFLWVQSKLLFYLFCAMHVSLSISRKKDKKINFVCFLQLSVKVWLMRVVIWMLLTLIYLRLSLRLCRKNTKIVPNWSVSLFLLCRVMNYVLWESLCSFVIVIRSSKHLFPIFHIILPINITNKDWSKR